MGQWIKVHQFISRMDMAYAAADVVISRAGAIAISELCLVGKPIVLIPSPNVAEDHQTKNAMALVSKGAALMVRDAECASKGIPQAMELLKDKTRAEQMSQNLRSMASPHAADKIVDQIDKLLNLKC
jgi:UDP-N-acetylglucosamine--N-acetylmuramyl-(pentapeptide) pyrophosphoryl-undecaprenol N-acetylglucosamine transferase